MAGFLYYFPGLAEAKTAADLPKDCDLGHLDGSSLNTRRVENAGPDGNGGLIVAPFPESKQGRAAQCGFYKDRQEWIEVQTVADDKEKTTHWLGWEKDDRPTPEDLARKHPCAGWPVDLCGHDWVIPCVHVPITTLPRRFVMQAAGPILSVSEKYEDVCEMAAQWYREAASGEFKMTYKDSFSFAVELLAINYRIGQWEASAIGILDTQSTMNIVDAGIGVPQILAENESKKKDDIQPTG